MVSQKLDSLKYDLHFQEISPVQNYKVVPIQ